MNTMGKRIKEKRTSLGLTMEELGSKLGVQPSAVNKWEKGTVQNIKRSTIEQMAAMFGCSPSWLMGFDSEEECLASEFTEIIDTSLGEIEISIKNPNSMDAMNRLSKYADMLKTMINMNE